MPSDRSSTVSRRRLLRQAVPLAGVAAICLAVTGGSRTAHAADRAGLVDKLEGEAQATVGRLARPLATGSAVYVGDHLETGPRSRLRLRMVDGTTLTLGADSTIVIEDVGADADRGSGVLRLVRGVFLAATAAIAGRKWDSLTVITDDAVLGVRGTTVWGGKEPDRFSALLIDGTSVRVESPEGVVELREPLDGTDVVSGRPPTPPKRWGDARIAAALASVAFD